MSGGRVLAAGEAVWLGVDVGTQGARVLAVTASGEVAGRGSHPLAGVRDGARHEQDPRDWLEAVTVAARAALRDVPAGAVGGLAVCGTSGTFVITDAAGTPRTPGLMFDDGRAGPGELAVPGVWRPGQQGLLRVPPSWPLAKLAWLRRHEPGIFRGGARLAHQADVVTAHLVGRWVPADSSHALKTGYDLVAQSWPADVFGALGIPESVLPAVVRPGALLGHVSARAARATAIPEGTAVFAGMTDGCASQIASGALRPGDWNSVLGTTLVVKGVSAAPVRDAAGSVYSHRGPDGHWLPGGASSAGAGALSTAFPGADLAALDQAAAARGLAGAIAYPLPGRGERFPLAAPRAHAFMVGQPADQLERYAAILQGVAYVERLALAYMSYLGAPAAKEITFTGGGSRSRYWNQLRSDVLGLPARVPRHPEAAFGMAVMAAYAHAACDAGPAEGGSHGAGGTAAVSLAGVAAHMVEVRDVIEPRPGHSGPFAAQYRRLLDELERRGWLAEEVADFARKQS